MQIELTDHAQRLVDQMLAEGRFESVSEAVECALEFLHNCQPTMETLSGKLREAHQDHEAGRSVPLDMQEIKEELQQRIHNRHNA